MSFGTIGIKRIIGTSKYVACVALCLLLWTASSVAQNPYKYAVEFNSGSAIYGVWMHYDSTIDVNYIRSGDTNAPIPLKRVDVKRILTISDPIHPPRELGWMEQKDEAFIPVSPDACDCLGHERSTSFHVLDAKLGLSLKGKSTYTQATPTGPVTENSVFFGPFNKGSTNLDIEAGTALGWRIHHWDVGLQVEVIPTDGFFYFPVSLHTRYYFDNDCCSWNLFLNAGIPFDFQTGAPIFITPLFDKRQRRYLSLGVGKIWPMTESSDFAIDLGYRYMVIPLDQIQCCPSIAFANRFPARESHSVFLQVGLAW